MNDVKIVFPLDVSTLREGYRLMEDVGPYIDIAKVGLELIHNVGTPAAVNMVREFGNLLFVDAKLNDIPNTVEGAAKALTKHKVDYFNVMASGGRPMMEAAVNGAASAAGMFGVDKPKIIAVTILTSLKLAHLVELGIAPARLLSLAEEKQQEYVSSMSEGDQQAIITQMVMKWASAAVSAGVDCILSSPLETAAMRSRWPDKELFSPGIRMPWDKPDDQGRTASPGEAAKAGVNAIVVGRPIRKPSGGRTRDEVLRAINDDISRALADK